MSLNWFYILGYVAPVERIKPDTMKTIPKILVIENLDLLDSFLVICGYQIMIIICAIDEQQTTHAHKHMKELF